MKNLTLLFLLVVTLPTLGTAQTTTGTIVGSVSDPSGLAVAGAIVTLTHTTATVHRKTITTANGDFAFNTVEPGNFNLTIEVVGFKKFERTDINLAANDRLSVGTITLQVGNTTDSVTVKAEGTAVQTASSEHSGLLTSAQVDNLLIKGRNVVTMLQLLPGVVDTNVPDAPDRNFAIGMNINGDRRNSIGLWMDGVQTQDSGVGWIATANISMDAVSEVKVLLNNYQAEYGRMRGAGVVMVGKSGTRDFHGSLSYFKRHEQFNATDFFSNRNGLPKARYRYNMYSYTIGGPVYIPRKFNTGKNKLFFFWSQEFWPQQVAVPISYVTMPTALERTGNFSQSTNPNGSPIIVKDPLTGTPFAGNIAPQNRIDPNGQALLNFIRGDRTNEGIASNTSKYFRLRTSVLGDIVDSEAVYVKAPQFEYADTGYSTYKTNNSSRQGMVYVGANDGMLHAFNSDTGAEVWAYVPQTLLPNLYKLADKFYATKHQYYVDGSPTQADVYFGGAWHTILVGGFNSGGRGFYALDVTNPASPKALWEVSNSTTNFGNMGYSYGRPEVTKLKDGTWVVLLTSGYNNVLPGDGQGYLYVVNAGTGALIRSIGTGQGSDTAAVTGVCDTAPCPSGLAQIRAWVDNTKFDNTTQRVYGGDLFGNVWRFDVNGDVGASGYDAQLLATLRGSATPANAQSVTTKPELGKVAGFPVVYVGTGRYLGASDLSDSTGQSIYAIKDNLGSTSLGNPRATGTTFVRQTLTNATCAAGQTFCAVGTQIRTGSANSVNFATNNGWYVDLPGTRERANTDPQLSLGTLAVTTNLLNPSACTVGGTSFVNFFDYRTGAPVSTANGLVSVFLGGALATRPVLLRFSDGTVRSLIRMSDDSWQTPRTPIPPSPGGTRRTSWRELVTE